MPQTYCGNSADVLIVGQPKRAAKRPEVERVDGVVGVDARAVAVALVEPGERLDRIARVERLGEHEREEQSGDDADRRSR